MSTSVCEVFAEATEAPLCPNTRVALVRPIRGFSLFDLTAAGAALAVGALPTLADGPHPRALTQEWARAIREDQPAEAVQGIRYRSAYNGGLSLTLWNTETWIKVVRGADGTPQDFPLYEGPMLDRMLVAMSERRVVVRFLDEADCPRTR